MSEDPVQRLYTLGEIASHIGAALRGDAACQVAGLNTLQNAKSGELSFLANPAYRRYLSDSQAGAVILNAAVAESYSGNALVMDNPYLGYALATALFDTAPAAQSGIHPAAVVADSARVHDTAWIGPNAVIGERVQVGANTQIGAGSSLSDNTVIGTNCRVAANVSIYHDISIGDNVIIHSGSVIGADGFGFAPGSQGWVKIHQLGGVEIGNNVEIGACTTIDRGALDNTVIAAGVIIDNHVQVAHNAKVGENTAMAAYAGIAGSATVGKNCTMAGQSGVVGHITICDGVMITSGTIASKSIREPGSYSSGTPTIKSGEWRKNAVRFNQLDELAKRIKQLEKK